MKQPIANKTVLNNHHYVSQCLIKNFFNQSEKRSYLYDKKHDNYFYKEGTKRIFSANNLNITLEDNKISEKLEKDLCKYFEKDFTLHYNNVVSSLENFEVDIKRSIEYLGRMGVIGEVRNKDYKRQTDKEIYEVFKGFQNHSTPELKKGFDMLFSA